MKGKELKRLRKRLALSQAQLAERVGVRSNTLARWERDEISITEPVARLLRLIGKGVV